MFARGIVRLAKYVIKRDPYRAGQSMQASIIPAENVMKLTNRDLSVYIAETATVESMRALGLPNLISHIKQRQPLMTPKDLFRITTGLARMDVIHNTGLMETLIPACSDKKRLFLVHELSGIAVDVSACTRRMSDTLKPENRQNTVSFISLLANEFKVKLEAASPTDLAHMAVALADSGISDPELMTSIASSAEIQIAMFKGPELADLILAFATLGLKSESFLARGIPQLITRMPFLFDQQLLQLSFSICRLLADVSDSKHKLIDRYVQELESRSFSEPNLGWSDFVVSAKQLNLLERLPKTTSKIPRDQSQASFIR